MVCAAQGASFPCGSVVKNLPGMQETDIGSIHGWGRSPGGGNGNPLSIFTWKIPWSEEPGRLQSMGSQKSQTQLSDLTTNNEYVCIDRFIGH